MSWGTAGLAMSVAGEVGIGIRSPPEESWPLLLCEGGEMGPSPLAEHKKAKKKHLISTPVIFEQRLSRGTHVCPDWWPAHVYDQELMQGKTLLLGSAKKTRGFSFYSKTSSL